MSIKENYERVRDQVAAAAVKAGRDPSSVTIVAVTKTHGPDKVREALRAGLRDIGENRVQEFLAKADAVDLPCRWHLIGHLQSNKVGKVLGRFALIHSVDSFKLAEKLSRAGEEKDRVTDILLEVNTSGEGSKFGLRPEETVELCEGIQSLRGIRLRGLMTVGPWVEDRVLIGESFRKLRLLGEEIRAAGIDNISMEHLSMGMTDDFEIAIAEGATLIRLGRVIFGARGEG
ncbi:MAG: YggS family pyridoxal phosphate-dependent enzyme [Candidatus Krumholzibacteriota bacterium]|nr:YggS family pyridoxal phosphate-dependent enzyme [Candidatus Krumholzibacteriota bacterium]